MLNVDNRKTIQNLAIKSFQSNKLRNVFAVIAIVLTTVLFTSLFTIGSSLVKSMQESTMRQVGGSAHGSFKYLNQEEYQNLKSHKSIKEIGYSVVLGFAENKDLVKRPTEIRYASNQWLAESFFAYPTTGRLPQKANELATDKLVLEKLGIPCKLGEKVIIEYSLSGEKVTDTFTLVGFWEGDKVIPASQIWLSKNYVQDKLEGYHPSYKDDPVGTINADVNFSNSFQIEKKIQKVIVDSGYHIDDIKYGVNWAYIGNKEDTDMSTLMGFVGIIILIIFCGYLIISNIFYISIAKDIQNYGLLKAIGTTSKQIKAIIRKQAGLLCFIGIPVGLIGGFLVGKALTPIVFSILNTNVISISLNPIIFIGSAIFSIITVFISTNKPAKMAGKVSPIEAIRKTDNISRSKHKIKKGNKTNLFKMAKANVFRNYKKMILVTLSLSLSLIILNCTYSIVNSFDMNKFLKESIENDFTIADAAYFNVYVQYTGQDTLSDEFLKELYSQKGIKETGNIYFSELNYPVDNRICNALNHVEEKLDMSSKDSKLISKELKGPYLTSHLYGLDPSILDHLEVFEGKIDMDKFNTGKYVIVSPYDTSGKISFYKVGDNITIDFKNGNKKEYEVMATASIPYCMSIRHSHPIDPNFFIPSGEYITQKGKTAPMLTSFNVNEKYINKIESYLSDYCNLVNKDMQFESKETFKAEFEGLKNTFLSVGLVVSSIVAFIGIMNFINTIVTSIIARKRELAMLHSIGMTKKQLNKMLVYEGVLYVLLTTAFVLTLGTVIGYYGILTLMGSVWFFSTTFTILPSILCLPILVAFAFIVPLISYRFTNNKSVVEQLREVD